MCDFRNDDLFGFIFAAGDQPLRFERVRVRTYDLPTLEHIEWVRIEKNGDRVQQHPEMSGHAGGDNSGPAELEALKRQNTIQDTTIQDVVGSQIPHAPALPTYQHQPINIGPTTVKRDKCFKKKNPTENLKISFVQELKERLDKIQRNKN